MPASQYSTSESVQQCGHQIASVMETLHNAASSQDREYTNRLLLASGFLCLAAWTLGGMGGSRLANKIVKLHYLLSNLGQDTYNTTNQANPTGSSPQAN